MARRKRTLARTWRFLRWAVRIALILLIVDLVYLATIWPDWKRLSHGPVPKSNFMLTYERQRSVDGGPKLHWQPVALTEVPKHLIRAVLLAEDIRFYSHSGFDLIAFKEAMGYNLAEGRLALGASTISQQTTKNLFLTASRNPLRKWHELILTWGLEHHLKKGRILEIYLNVAEFGRGVYGIEAASQVYWGVPASGLNLQQAAELAATLPGPTKHNPTQRTEYFQKRSKKILNLLVREYGIVPDDVNTLAPSGGLLPPDPLPSSRVVLRTL